jgi:hypothetical protein
VRKQPISDVIKGVTSKFMHIFEGPYIVIKIFDHSVYELRDESNKLQGEFYKRQLQVYRENGDETHI